MTDANLIILNRRLPMDLTAFTAVASGFTNAIKAGKAILELKVDAEVALRVNSLIGQLGDLSGKFLAAQTAHIESEERARELREEIGRLHAFAAESERYALQEIAPGAFCYSLKSECQGGDPIHHLCANCYGKKTKSILQFSGFEAGYRRLTCPACSGSVLIKDPAAGVAFAVSTRSRRSMLDGF
jgi:Zn finger protein HypA/HybF involved in hydrogenase expression